MAVKLIKLRNLEFSYQLGSQEVSILNSVDFDVAEGEMVAIKGPSGSGKSTMLYLVGGLLKPKAGRIKVLGRGFDGCSSDDLSRLRRDHIGFIFQQFHLVPGATVLENILLGVEYTHQSASKKQEYRERAIALAQRMGIGDRLDHLPNELSGGQQQRVAIARALIKNPKIILADEPTGNLDSKSTKEILAILGELHQEGQTLVVITHDDDVAQVCQRVVEMKDGKLQNGVSAVPDAVAESIPLGRGSHSLVKDLKLAVGNLGRNKLRSMLTMLGVTIGIASVLAMTTIGEFTKRTILSGYETMGVNRLSITGMPNYRQKATDRVKLPFRGFDEKADYRYLPKVFPEINLMSRAVDSYGLTAIYGGKAAQDLTIKGVSSDYLAITGIDLALGKNFTPIHVDKRLNVCLIGHEIFRELFKNTNPIGKLLFLSTNDKSHSCRISGVLPPLSHHSEWKKPNRMILTPYTYLTNFVPSWQAHSESILIKAHKGVNVEELSLKVKTYFEMKYGAGGMFFVDKNDVMVSQLKRFLNIFSLLLGAIAVISLLVGGIGIANMMLVSVAERMREIGLRKALGATDGDIKRQFLIEAVVLCTIAGLVGVVMGFLSYQGLLLAASHFVEKVAFEWLFEPWPIAFSLLSTGLVGILSGVVPAMRAQNLQVMDALRSE